MQWDKLSMADRAKYIKLGVQNGITDLSTIREVYNKYDDGGNMDTPEEDKYTPSTLAGWITQMRTKDDSKAANADIASAAANTGLDFIPVFGNAAGMVMSIGDAIYDTGKFVLDPSWSNAADIGTSLLGIVPGIGSIKDAKNVARATKQLLRNIEVTRSPKALTRTIARKSNPKSNTRINVLRPDLRIQRSYPLSIPQNPYLKLTGTAGGWYDTMGNGLSYNNYYVDLDWPGKEN